MDAHRELLGELRRKRLKAHELGVTPAKSYVSSVSDGVEYLGFYITPARISVRSSSYKKMFATISSVITSHKYHQRLDRVLWRLNLKITGCRYKNKNFGWMFFFLQTDDLTQLGRLDAFVRAQLKKNSVGDIEGRIKTFIKTYHEIRYNLAATTYVPDFDNYTIAQMKETIKLIRGTMLNFETFSDEEIRAHFFAIVGGEVSALERDLIESLS